MQSSRPPAPTTTRAATDPKPDTVVDIPSHGVSTGLGAVLGGAAVGAATGTIAGPVGTVIGVVAGAIAGGLAGDAVANSVDQVSEDAHWRETWQSRPYVPADATYDDFGPAYVFGVIAFERYPDQSFDAVAGDLSDEWPEARGESMLEWDAAQPASRDAWQRLEAAASRSA